MFFHDKNINIALRYSFNFLGNFKYQIKIPIHYYKKVFSELEEKDRFKEILEPDEFLDFSSDKQYAYISFDALNRNHQKSRSLALWFDWLNLGPKDHEEPKNSNQYQIALLDISGNDVSVSFNQWVSDILFDNETLRSKICANTTRRINLFMNLFFENKRMEIEPQYNFDKKGMSIYMFSNGLWIAGSYQDLTTHNCDSSFQQFRFVVAIMEIIKELQKIKPLTLS